MNKNTQVYKNSHVENYTYEICTREPIFKKGSLFWTLNFQNGKKCFRLSQSFQERIALVSKYTSVFVILFVS